MRFSAPRSLGFAALIAYVGIAGAALLLRPPAAARGVRQVWTDISGALPDLPANTVLIDPETASGSSPRMIYVGTDIGIYRLQDVSPATWQTFGNGMPFVPVTDLIYNATTRQLVAATYGRGIWTISSRFSR